jgi:hypothetical protein
MLLSRLWFLVLAIAASAGIAVSFVATRLLDEKTHDQVVRDLVRDRLQLEQLLKLDARARIDAIGPITANGDVRSALREANGRQPGAEIPEATRARLRTRLGELNQQLGEMAGDLVFAVDERGIIVAQVGGGAAPPATAGLGAFPLVERALAGYGRDDVWLWNGELYRMAARPVIENGRYAGAIVHGKRIDDIFASRIVTRLSGASVGFFVRDQIVGSAMPEGVSGAPRRDDMGGPLATVLGGPFAQGEVGAPSTLPTGGLAIYAPVVGAASYAQAGYVLARPVPTIGSPLAIIQLASSQDWMAALPLMGAVVLVMMLLAMILVYFEHDRPLVRFREAAVRVGKRELDRFQVQDFGGSFRIAASALNEALDKLQEQAGQAKKKVADLDSILGEAPAPPSASFFGFAGGAGSVPDGSAIPGSVPDGPAVPRPAAVAPAPPPAAPAAPAAPARPAAPPPTAAAPPAAPAPPLGAPRAAPTAAAPPAAPAPPLGAPRAAPAVPAAPKPPGPPTAGSPLASTLIGVGVAGATGAPVQAPRPPPSLADDDDGDEGQTMVSRVPEELIKQSATGAFSAVSGDEAHFKDVFQQFVATKQQCGEPTAGLTYDKFKETLRKNQEKIQQAHGTSKVRFTVYVKDGKAALKATPIK